MSSEQSDATPPSPSDGAPPVWKAEAVEPALHGFSEPHHLHPSSVVFQIASHIRQLIVPLVLGSITAFSGSNIGAAMALTIFGLAVGFTLLRYFTLRYQIHDGELTISEGLLFRRVRVIPLDRIQNIDLVQNLFHRMLGVAEVVIETASGGEAEARLRVLPVQRVEQLRHIVLAPTDAELPDVQAGSLTDGKDGILPGAPPSHSPTANASAGSPNNRANAATLHASNHAIERPDSSEIYRIPARNLVLAGLASNRGMVILAAIVGFFFQQGWEEPDIDQLLAVLPSERNQVILYLSLFALVLGMLIVLRILGILWYVLRFYDYRLHLSGNDLRIECGMFTRVRATVPRGRIQFVSVHRPLFWRWLKLASIRIETAGGAGSSTEDARSTISRRWFCPVVNEADVQRIVATLRPDSRVDWANVQWGSVSQRALYRLMRLAAMSCVLVGVAGYLLLPAWGALIGAACLPAVGWLAWKQAKARKLAKTESCILFRSGLLYQKLSFIFFDRIQVITMRQTPFDRRWKMATLGIDTAAAGPADHIVQVHLLDHDVAQDLFEDLLRRAASCPARWQ